MSNYWICCRTRHGDEFRQNDKLQSIGLQTYLPIRKTDIRTKRKCRTVTSALYPPYLFVNITTGLDGTDIHPIKKYVKIVQIKGEPIRATDKLIDYVKNKEKEAEMLKYEYEKGDKIRLSSGALSGYEGEIQKLSKADKAIIKILTTGKFVEVYLKDAEPIDA